MLATHRVRSSPVIDLFKTYLKKRLYVYVFHLRTQKFGAGKKCATTDASRAI